MLDVERHTTFVNSLTARMACRCGRVLDKRMHDIVHLTEHSRGSSASRRAHAERPDGNIDESGVTAHPAARAASDAGAETKRVVELRRLDDSNATDWRTT